ncbi:dihydroorotase [Microaerobacter geothermalis]|uniref:dihydroorotase n=1 Tax=Microaerobacter geothermalis TaxID=674972 RepID=UPI001F3DEFFC|nr:dihydroorotase [Microaerobacter geothermalis]MCF6094763.1 dihydroorotase [Microaerobacter geothermalis]
MGILFKNAHVLRDHEQQKLDVLIENGKIKQINRAISEGDHEVIPLNGKLLLPGFVDMHVHLREPGFEGKETIATGTLAAAKGGFTTIACMPNTKPVIDSSEVVQWIKNKAREVGNVRVLPIGAITIRELGKELTDFSSLKAAGVVALSDDGVGIQDAAMMKEAMNQAAKIGLSIVAHCEDDSLAKGGCVHEGVFSRKFGLKGIPSEAESIHIARDVLLAEATGVHYHVCHISTKESVRAVREAKKNGIYVTAEVSPHHLLLCDEDIPGLDPNYKMNPPLRGKEDREALIEGLIDGTIDIIATDHAPHMKEEKERGMEKSPFGIVGLETAFPLLYTHLVEKGIISLAKLVDLVTVRPAQLFQLPWGKLVEGASADLTVVNLAKEKEVNPSEFASKGKNTPFTGWKLQGWPEFTMVEGKIIWNELERREA